MWFFRGNDTKKVSVDNEKKLEKITVVERETKGTQTGFPEITDVDRGQLKRYQLEVDYYWKIIGGLELKQVEFNFEDVEGNTSVAREMARDRLQRIKDGGQKLDDAIKSIHEKTMEFTKGATESQQDRINDLHKEFLETAGQKRQEFTKMEETQGAMLAALSSDAVLCAEKIKFCCSLLLALCDRD